MTNKTDAMGNKLYPFSKSKNAHNIEFRYNRMKNIDDASEEFEKVKEIVELMYDLNLNVIWLTGKQLQVAKESIAWAIEERSKGR